MKNVLQTALEIQAWLVARNWRFCIIGGVAIQRWGQPRVTQDVDLTLLTGFGGEEVFVDLLLAAFAPRIANAREMALRSRVVLLQDTSGIGIDIALGAVPFEERAIARASWFALGDGQKLLTCSAEDLVVHKLFAGRPQDWADLEQILARQKCVMNFDLIREEVLPLLELKEAADSWDRFLALRDRTLLRLSSTL